MGVSRPISPPLSRRKPAALASTVPAPTWGFDGVPPQIAAPILTAPPALQSKGIAREGKKKGRYVASPIQLTSVQDLTRDANVNTVGLRGLLGDPMIKECWNFNFLFDLDFVMWVFLGLDEEDI
jgi:tyrosyl-DNA phosphodiesterase-1